MWVKKTAPEAKVLAGKLGNLTNHLGSTLRSHGQGGTTSSGLSSDLSTSAMAQAHTHIHTHTHKEISDVKYNFMI